MKSYFLFAAIVATFLSVLPLQASPLSDAAEQAGVNWMLGTWSDATGETVTLTFEWKLEKNAVGLKLKAPDREVEGVSVLKPGTEEVHYFSVDSKGGVSHGRWFEHDGHPSLRVKYMTAEGEEKSMVVEHIKVDENTMKIKVYKGEDPDTAESQEFELKRKK